jgi:hypothetical protein
VGIAKYIGKFYNSGFPSVLTKGMTGIFVKNVLGI